MNANDKSSAIAAAIILVGLGLVFFYLPTIMLALGDQPVLAALVVAIVVVGPFVLFWLRGRYKSRRED